MSLTSLASDFSFYCKPSLPLHAADGSICLPSPVTRHADGGGERDRTDDLLLAKQALSQLSYTPRIGGSGWVRTIDPRLIKTVL
jgi:hypothetical protein